MNRLNRRGFTTLLATMLATGGQAMADAPPEGPYGKWQVEEIGGQPASTKAAVTIDIGTDGRVTGSGGCNRFSGSVKIDSGAISFGPAASTKMMCEPEISEQEAKFFQTLEKVKGWKWDGPALTLLDGAGKVVLRLAAA